MSDKITAWAWRVRDATSDPKFRAALDSGSHDLAYTKEIDLPVLAILLEPGAKPPEGRVWEIRKSRRFVRVVDGRIVRVMSDDEAPSITPLTPHANNTTKP